MVIVLVEEVQGAGRRYEASFDASGLASGTYVVRMTAGAAAYCRAVAVVR